MKRLLFPALMLIVIGGIVWWWSGGGQRVTADRIETTLVANGVPAQQAACMATDMAERLSITQLRKLERLGPEEGEARVPSSLRGFLDRLRRVDDPEAIRVTARSAAVCALGMG